MRFSVFAILACAPAFAQLWNAPAHRVIQRQVGPVRDKIEHSDGTVDSTNWSGYLVQGSEFTSVKGTWVVPSVVCSFVTETQYAATWVGMDGWGSSTLEQIGTMSECDGSTPRYWAWFEFFPSEMYVITVLPVNSGNVISASVVYEGGQFTVNIKNETSGESYSTSSVVEGAVRNTAEWIAEAPCCTTDGGVMPLADFGTTQFGQDDTRVPGFGTGDATDAANSGSIGSFGSRASRLTKIGTATSPQISRCSILSREGSSFSCTWGSGN